MRRTLALALPAAMLAALPGFSRAAADDWYAKAVKGVAAAFEPAEARPGQTVVFKLTVDLNAGYFTYPLHQPEKASAGLVNKVAFPAAGAVVFVGEAADPDKLPTKAEPVVGIQAMRYCPGTTTYTRKAVVSPKAAAGDVKVALAEFRLSVCDEANCYRPKSVPVEAALKVLEGAVPVAPEYADEVAKALAGK